MTRKNAVLALGISGFAALSGMALAQQQPAASAAAAAPPAAAAAPADPNAQQFSINQNVGDWVVRCVQTTIKSPAPCEVMQTTVNKDSQQRISSFSIAYVPSRESYAMQVVVPTGVALGKGLSIAPALNSVKFTRCERDGCYVEMLIDNATVTSLGGAGKSASIAVFGYGQEKQITLPVSMTGFPEAMDRMKSFAKDRAVALPNNASPLPAPPPAVGPAPAKR
jgi:invasion protein IalB